MFVTRTSLTGALAALLIAAAPAAADTIAVDRSDDADVATCTAAPHDCTLRGALERSQTPGAAADTITVPAGRILLTAPLPVVGTNPVTVSGAGARATIIDGHGTVANAFVAATTVLTLEDLAVSGIGPLAAGASAVSGNVVLARDAIVDNQGIGVAAQTLLMDDTTVARNTGVQEGGVVATQPAVIRDSTISDNTAVPLPGATPLVLGAGVASASFTVIEHSTIAGNTAGARGALLGGENITQEQIVPVQGTTLVSSSIIEGGTDGSRPNCGLGPVQSRGNNVSSDHSCGVPAIGDRTSVDPLLASLADNGGPTDTRALLPGSPAIDNGVDCPATDQRGATRAQGTTCDAGAYESSLTAPLPPAAPSPAPTAPGTTAPANSTPAADRTPPTLTIGSPGRSVTAAKLRRGLTVRIGADEPIVAAAALSIATGHSKTPTVQLASSTILVRDRVGTVTLRSSATLPHTSHITAQVRVAAFDLAGNRSSRMIEFTISNPAGHQHPRATKT